MNSGGRGKALWSERPGPLLAGVWCLLAALYLTFTYASVTPDSYFYAAAAEAFHSTANLSLPFAPSSASTLPVPFSAWAPGFPVGVGLLAGLGIDVWIAARVLVFVSMLAILAWTWIWLPRLPNGCAAFALLATCGMTAVMGTSIWSEAPFFLAVLLLFAGLLNWQDGPTTKALVLVSAGLCMALSLRYAGWFLLPGTLFVLLQHPRGRAIRTGTFLFLSATPAVAWWIRNFLLSATARAWSWNADSLWRAAGETSAALGKVALVPWTSSVRLQAIAGAVLGITLCVKGCPRVRVSQWRAPDLAFVFGLSLVCGTWGVRMLDPSLLLSDRHLWPGWIFLAWSVIFRLDPISRFGVIRPLVWGALLFSQTAGLLTLPNREPRTDLEIPLPAPAEIHSPVLSNEAWRAWRQFGLSGYYLTQSRWKEGVFAPDSLERWAAGRGVKYLVWYQDETSVTASQKRYGPLGILAEGGNFPGLELVASGTTYHTYRIQSSGAP